MGKIPKILIIGALFCTLIAIVLKLTRLGQVLPYPPPLNWAKLADTMLFFSIALSLIAKK
jgi:hypothetical protein